MKLSQLENPSQIKNLSLEELEDLANQIRLFLLQSISQTGGHLSSNLGVIELTLALHYVFDSPKDKIIFDVGHQSYTHKIITGRLFEFDHLRQFKGLSGYQKRNESEHDPWEAGHSSTSISAGLGLAIARDLNHEHYEVISVIGDGALGGGMALEALNDLGAQNRKMIVVFNDNAMSISPNISGIESSITKLRTSKVYRDTKKDLYDSLITTKTGLEILDFLRHSRDCIKEKVIDAPLFSDFGLDYIGPVDGTDMGSMISALQTAKEHDGPIVVHVLTTKGKGYAFAENDEIGEWHGVSPFDLTSGQAKEKPSLDTISWSQVIARTLNRFAFNDPKLCVITPAMATGSELIPFSQKYPDRFFDVGIAEEHAVTMAGAMAQGGLHPFVSIYSSFLQRAYDQVLHDVARMDLPVVFGVDRAGLVGSDGDTHQGIYDIAFLSTIPNTIIAQPKNATEAQNLLYTAFQQKHPFFVRYPRGKVNYSVNLNLEQLPIGTWTYCQTQIQSQNSTFNFDHQEKKSNQSRDEITRLKQMSAIEQIIISYGPQVETIEQRAILENKNWLVVNARYLKPLDIEMLDVLQGMNTPITVYETDEAQGGLADQIAAYFYKKEQDYHVVTLRDGYIQHGKVDQLLKEQNCSIDNLFEQVNAYAS